MPERRSISRRKQAWIDLAAHARQRPRLTAMLGFLAVLLVGATAYVDSHWYDWFEKRVATVVPGKLTRGAWQRPPTLRKLIDREGIRTVVTLAVIDEKIERYDDQARILKEKGVNWIFVPMVDSTATLEQMAEAADLLADPALQPVFFHCVAGHHRTSLAHAAYRIRHEGWSAEQAWNELVQYRWTRPGSDTRDHDLIKRFADQQRQVQPRAEAFAWPGLGLDSLRR